MGAILAVRSRSGGDRAVEILDRMAAESPHRGRLECLRVGPVVLGVQSLGWDASLAENDGLVLAVHGYLCLLDQPTDKSASAAEIVGSLWAKEGTRAVAELDGEFALVVVDRESGDLIAASSVGGTRSLFFAGSGDVLALGTEVRQVRAALDLEPHLDELGLVQMLLQRPVAEESTLDRMVSRAYHGRIYRFQPGESAHPPISEPYWEPPSSAEAKNLWSFEESAKRLRSVLATVVGDSIPDQPWALSLSGGRDSSALWGLADRSAGRPVSLEFPGMACDERQLIEDTVEHVGGADPLWVDAAAENPFEKTESLLPLLDAPLFPTTYLGDLAAAAAHGDSRNVLLKGNGGDEWLGGAPLAYEQEELASSRWRRMWYQRARPAVGGALRRLGLRQGGCPPIWLSKRGWRAVREAAGPDWVAAQKRPVRAHLARTLHLRRTSFELWAMEQTAASHGVEVRLPFMHRRVIDFAFEVPPQHVTAGGREKHLLRMALQGSFAPSVEGRLERTYFSEPFVRRAAELRQLFGRHDWVLPELVSIDRRGIETLIRECDSEPSLRSLASLYLADRFVATLRRA